MLTFITFSFPFALSTNYSVIERAMLASETCLRGNKHLLISREKSIRLTPFQTTIQRVTLQFLIILWYLHIPSNSLSDGMIMFVIFVRLEPSFCSIQGTKILFTMESWSATEWESCESWETKSVHIWFPSEVVMRIRHVCLKQALNWSHPVVWGMSRWRPAPVMQEGLQLGFWR